jgi:hypothetical protein
MSLRIAPSERGRGADSSVIGGGKRELPQSNFTRSRMQVFSLLSACKWIIFLSLLFSAILYLPDQIRELYRIAYANRTFTDLADEISQKAEGPGLKYQGPLIAEVKKLKAISI